MKTANRLAIYLLGTITLFGGSLAALWNYVSVDVETQRESIIENVNSELFEKPSASVKRDIFSYPNVGRKSQARKSGKRVRATKATAAPTDDNLPGELSYVGLLVRDGVKNAFILHHDDKYVVRVGEFVATRFRVTEIQEQYVLLKKEPKGKKYTLYMSE